jgi:hypothetical protein
MDPPCAWALQGKSSAQAIWCQSANKQAPQSHGNVRQLVSTFNFGQYQSSNWYSQNE